MKDLIEEFARKHPELKVEQEEFTYVINEDGAEKTNVYCMVSGFPGNENVTLALREPDDFKSMEGFLAAEPQILKELVGCRIADSIHVLLSPVSRHLSPMYWRREELPPISIKSHYFGNTLMVTIAAQKDDAPFPFLIEHARQLRRRWRNPLVATITGLAKPTDAGIESDIRAVLNSLLFDIEYTYGVGWETASFDSLQFPRFRRRRRYHELPNEELAIVFKDYIPELLEYYHAGEKVDYLPFKYVCYFHVLEYFSDKSAYQVVSQAIRAMLLRPDFHESVETYVNRAIQLVKKESERNITDKIKVTRVLRQYTTPDEVQSYLEEVGLFEHFEKDCVMQCAKPLTLPALDFSSENSFYETLTRRIYSLRCSIVHSNPDFEDSKAIPFVPRADNLELLRMEIELLSEIARSVVVKSARN